MTKAPWTVFAILASLMGWSQTKGDEPKAPKTPPSLYEIAMKDIEGHEVSLASLKGKVLLIVNVASRCGFTPQYEGLQKLYEEYREKGLVVLGFPANDFGAQEPGTDEEIKSFCQEEYQVTFPLFSKISVKGKAKHPLYQWLTDKTTNPGSPGEVKWNFTKFLVDREGRVVDRFESRVSPESEKLLKRLKAALEAVQEKSPKP